MTVLPPVILALVLVFRDKQRESEMDHSTQALSVVESGLEPGWNTWQKKKDQGVRQFFSLFTLQSLFISKIKFFKLKNKAKNKKLALVHLYVGRQVQP